MDWFNIIKDFSAEEIFAALGLDHSLTDYSEGSNEIGVWDEEHKKVTLRVLNFMKGLSNVEWKSTRLGHFAPQELDIYGEVTVGDVMITTPKVNIHDIGVDVRHIGECAATTVSKDGYDVRICVNPDYDSKNPWGDFLATSVLFYNAILTQDIPLGQTSSPELVWLAGVAQNKTQIKGSPKDKWGMLQEVMRSYSGITDRNWEIIKEELRTVIERGRADKRAKLPNDYYPYDYRDVEG